MLELARPSLPEPAEVYALQQPDDTGRLLHKQRVSVTLQVPADRGLAARSQQSDVMYIVSLVEILDTPQRMGPNLRAPKVSREGQSDETRVARVHSISCIGHCSRHRSIC